jgi:alkylation response protein AidB-like acyl-CoA dehydrogenase
VLDAGTDDLRAEVRDFLRHERECGGYTPRVDSWMSGWSPDFSRKLGQRGWLCMAVPKHLGGHGRTYLDRYVVTEELLAAGAPVAAHWIADRQVAPALVKYGTPQQQRTYLPGIASGETYFAIGMSEPEAGSDLAAVRTRAIETDGGWRLSGTKVWTSGAHRCCAFFVLARSEPFDPSRRHAGLSQFIVEFDSPGVEIRPIRLLTGEHHFNEVVLDNVFVPHDMVLGRLGNGWRQVTAELALERSGPERILSTMPLLNCLPRNDTETTDRSALGAVVARAYALRQLSMAVAGALSNGADVGVAAAVVKDLGTRFEQDVVEYAAHNADVPAQPGTAADFVRLLGEGLMHAPGFTLRGGTNEILRSVIARELGMR